MKKNLIKMMLAAVVVVASGVNIYNSQKESGISDVVLANVDALAGTEYFDSGTCKGTGAGFTDQYCPGGYTICCWAHTKTYGKN